MANQVRITITIDTEGKASIAFDTSETASAELMPPLDPNALEAQTARTASEKDEAPEPAWPTDQLISSAPEVDIAPRFYGTDEVPSISRPAIDVIPGPSMLEEFTPGSEIAIVYPQMEESEIMMAPASTGEYPEPPHLIDPAITASTSDDVPGPMSVEELSNLAKDLEPQ
jgi:hypothetical protein